MSTAGLIVRALGSLVALGVLAVPALGNYLPGELGILLFAACALGAFGYWVSLIVRAEQGRRHRVFVTLLSLVGVITTVLALLVGIMASAIKG